MAFIGKGGRVLLAACVLGMSACGAAREDTAVPPKVVAKPKPVAWGASPSDQTAVSLEFFGLHIHHAGAGTAWPDVPFGSWRLWDAYVDWKDVEPKRGVWAFQQLDDDVALAMAHQVDLLLPLAATPAWASARPQEGGGYGPGTASEPAQILDWQNYVRTLALRYKGRIRYWEIWNEPSDKMFYTGDLPKLVELTCAASRILKEVDPRNQILSPASAGGGGHVRYLDQFLAAGGKDCIDIVAHHFYVPSFGPEAMVTVIRDVKAVMQRNGIADKPLWNTETGWWIANAPGQADAQNLMKGGWRKLDMRQEGASVIQRAFLLARAEGVARFYWYAWDDGNLGLVDTKSGTDKPMVAGWRQAVSSMLGKRVERCTHASDLWRCTLQDADGKLSTLSWHAYDTLIARDGARLPLPGVRDDESPHLDSIERSGSQ